MEIYITAIDKFVPWLLGKETWKKPWYNERCGLTKRNGTKGGTNVGKKMTIEIGNEFKITIEMSL